MGNTETDNLAEQIERRVVVHREAQLETHAAFEYYEQISNGLGFDFMRSLDAAIQSVKRSPPAYQIIYKKFAAFC